MKRLISTSIDLLLFLPVVFLIKMVTQTVLLVDIDITIFILIGLPLMFSFFEYKYEGKTPGRFILGLSITNLTETTPQFHILYGRSVFLLYIYPAVYFGLFTINYYLLNGMHLSLLGLYASIILAPVFIFTSLLSFGKQSLHDILFNTKVTSKSPLNNNYTTKKNTYISMFISIFLVVLLVYYFEYAKEDIQKTINHSQIRYELNNKVENLKIPPPDTSTIGDEVDNLFEFYADLQGYFGQITIEFKNLEQVQALTSNVNPNHNYTAPLFKVFVTEKGLIDRFFKDKVVKNLVLHTSKYSPSSSCYVEFIYSETFIKVFAVRAKQILFGYELMLNDGKNIHTIPQVSPVRQGVSFSLTFLGWGAIISTPTVEELEVIHLHN